MEKSQRGGLRTKNYSRIPPLKIALNVRLWARSSALDDLSRTGQDGKHIYNIIFRILI